MSNWRTWQKTRESETKSPPEVKEPWQKLKQYYNEDQRMGAVQKQEKQEKKKPPLKEGLRQVSQSDRMDVRPPSQPAD